MKIKPEMYGELTQLIKSTFNTPQGRALLMIWERMYLWQDPVGRDPLETYRNLGHMDLIREISNRLEAVEDGGQDL